jgi:hypothetical protein
MKIDSTANAALGDGPGGHVGALTNVEEQLARLFVQWLRQLPQIETYLLELVCIERFPVDVACEKTADLYGSVIQVASGVRTRTEVLTLLRSRLTRAMNRLRRMTLAWMKERGLSANDFKHWNPSERA